jgi:hypothetical protein
MTAAEKLIIDNLIKSFKTYGLGDIRHNATKPIAAFILSICFVDQLASFRYLKRMSLTDRWEKFIDDYMPVYSGLDIYKYFRNTLVHNYSSRGKFALSNDTTLTQPVTHYNGRVIINTNLFIDNIEAAFLTLENEFYTDNSEAQKRALLWSKTHPVMTHQQL